MKPFVSIQTKMIMQTMITISIIFVTVLSFIIIKDMRTVNQNLEKSERNIRNTIIAKGKLLAKNNSMAMADMAYDLAFTSIRTLVSSAVNDDPDILYGIYMDSESMAWAFASEDNPSGKVSEKILLADEMSSWAKSLKEPGYKIYRSKDREIIEFCAPVEHENQIIGFVRYGISTTSMNQALSEVLNDSIRARNQIISMIAILAVLSFTISYFMVRRLAIKITGPIKYLVDLVQKIAQGNYNIPVIPGNNDEIGQLESDVEKMRIAIKKLTGNLEQLVEERTSQLQEANVNLKKAMGELWGEMALAKKIQKALLPKMPVIPGYQVCVYMEPADEVGGDYYDVINAAGKDWVVIGDVSGHGIPAGLIMMMTQTAIQTVVIENPQSQPSDLIRNVNRVISNNISRLGEDKYMTLTVLAVHEQGVFHFSGLHQDILIYRASQRKVECVETKGMWIGIIDDIDTMITDAVIKINKGDTLLLYTDGVTEAKKRDNPGVKENNVPMFGDENLVGFLDQHGDDSPDQIKNALLDTLKAYYYEDDVTFIVLKRDN